MTPIPSFYFIHQFKFDIMLWLSLFPFLLTTLCSPFLSFPLFDVFINPIDQNFLSVDVQSNSLSLSYWNFSSPSIVRNQTPRTWEDKRPVHDVLYVTPVNTTSVNPKPVLLFYLRCITVQLYKCIKLPRLNTLTHNKIPMHLRQSTL